MTTVGKQGLGKSLGGTPSRGAPCTGLPLGKLAELPDMLCALLCCRRIPAVTTMLVMLIETICM